MVKQEKGKKRSVGKTVNATTVNGKTVKKQGITVKKIKKPGNKVNMSDGKTVNLYVKNIGKIIRNICYTNDSANFLYHICNCLCIEYNIIISRSGLMV